MVDVLVSSNTRNLFERIAGRVHSTESLFEVFVEWVSERGFELYPAQE